MGSMGRFRTLIIGCAAAGLGAFCVSIAAQTVKENSHPVAAQGRVVPGSAQTTHGTNTFEGKKKSRKAADSPEPRPSTVKNVQTAAMDQSGKTVAVKDSRLVTRQVPPDSKAVTVNPNTPTPMVRRPSPQPALPSDQAAASLSPQAWLEMRVVNQPHPVEIESAAGAFLFAEPEKNAGPPTQVAETAVGIHPISLWNPEKQAVHEMPLAEAGKVRVLPVDQANTEKLAALSR